MKRSILTILASTLLSACATGASNPALADGRPTMPVSQDALVPAFATPHIVYPVRSVYEILYAKGYKPVAYTLNGQCSLTKGPSGVVTGCVISGGSTSPYYNKSSFYLHNKINGDGCTLAVGHFHGQTYAGQAIPIAFYWVNNSCYP